MFTTLILAGITNPAMADDNFKATLSTSPIVAVAILATDEDGADTQTRSALGLRSGYDFLNGTKGLGVAGSVYASYIGLPFDNERGGREWRLGLSAGPRFGNEAGRATEISLRVTAGLDFVNDTYRIDSLGDESRVPRAWLIGVPLKMRAVFTLVDLELGMSPQFFLDSASGNDEKAARPRDPWDGDVGDEFETSAGVGLRLGDRFRLGISQRTRWASYGAQTYLGLGLGVGV